MKPIALIGAGPMAVDYAKTLKGLDVPFVVVGRGEESAKAFEQKSGKQVLLGGIESFLKSSPCPKEAIVSTNIETLASVSATLLHHGVKKLLIEKPAGISSIEIQALHKAALEKGAEVWIAYNRRYYSSVQTAKRMIADDGGPLSFHFDFTEIPALLSRFKGSEGRKTLFLANSTHVVDMAYFLGGEPVSISAVVEGAGEEAAPMRFAGAGISNQGATFTYAANWAAPGRWGVEVMTQKRRFIFRPLEKLQIQEKGSFAVNDFDLENQLDLDFKPGLFRQTQAFLTGKDDEALMPLSLQANRLPLYAKMLGITSL